MTPPLLPAVELETAADPQWSVLWLHGLGADGHDFEPIVPELVRPHWPALRFVFPHAPVRPITINNGVPMRAGTTSPASISPTVPTRPGWPNRWCRPRH
jgi:predicted esterase